VFSNVGLFIPVVSVLQWIMHACASLVINHLWGLPRIKKSLWELCSILCCVWNALCWFSLCQYSSQPHLA